MGETGHSSEDGERLVGIFKKEKRMALWIISRGICLCALQIFLGGGLSCIRKNRTVKEGTYNIFSWGATLKL